MKIADGLGKISIFFLAVCLALGCFSSCSKISENDLPSVDEKSVSLLENGASRFVIVRSADSPTEETEAVLYLRDRMEQALGVDVKVSNDSGAEAEFEIVVGKVENRAHSAEIYDEVVNSRKNNGNDYCIRRKGNKIYICAASTDGIKAAADHFVETLCGESDRVIAAGYSYTYRPEYPLENASVGGVGIGEFVIRTEKYPSYLVTLAARELQEMLKTQTGHSVPIVAMTDELTHSEHEICIGPINGSVKVDMVRDTPYTSENIVSEGGLTIGDDGLLKDVAYGYYEARVENGSFYINGGSVYAVNCGMKAVMADFKENNGLPAGYSVSGTYQNGDESLSGGYSLVYSEDWDYTGEDSYIESEVLRRWTVSHDTTAGPTSLGDDMWDVQSRPGVYGDNWWIHRDKGNGYLLEITKKSADGYYAGRLISQDKWAFRYGILEARMVMATRNGACSALWTVTSSPEGNAPLQNEIDVYENFGYDKITASIHSWGPLAGEGNHTHLSNRMDPRVSVTPENGEHFWDTFHYLTLKWTDTVLEFYLDGELYASADITTEEMACMHLYTTIKLANGVGTKTYTSSNPENFLDDVEKFFEVQIVDNVRVYQTSGIDSGFTYSESHPDHVQ